jgi:tRNA nucleotidyltransferase (CCA-adding enzyme)
MLEEEIVIKYYLVGGAVRDMIMGVTCNDYDFVVVGATPSDFSDWKSVGKDFPVFLEPTRGWEVALARVERKVGVGYAGFETEWDGVTLEQDLFRRDLTINAMAIEVDFAASVSVGEPIAVGGVIDPFYGISDIKSKVLRHTSAAFIEDSVRVLRVARFLAKFDKYWVDGGNHWKCSSDLYKILESIDVRDLTPERVWLEMLKSFYEDNPSAFFDNISDWNNLFPEWESLWKTAQREDHHPEGCVGIHTGMVMDYAAKTWHDTEIIFASLCHDFGKPICWEKYGNAHGHEVEGLPIINQFCDKWKVPNSYRNLALVTCEYHTKVHGCMSRGINGWMKPKSIMKLFEDTGALKNPDRFVKMLKACEADAKGRGSGVEQIAEFEAKPYLQRSYLEDCLSKVLNYKSKPLAEKMIAEGKTGTIIGQTIRQERIKLIREVQNQWKERV